MLSPKAKDNLCLCLTASNLAPPKQQLHKLQFNIDNFTHIKRSIIGPAPKFLKFPSSSKNYAWCSIGDQCFLIFFVVFAGSSFFFANFSPFLYYLILRTVCCGLIWAGGATLWNWFLNFELWVGKWCCFGVHWNMKHEICVPTAKKQE